MSVTSFHAPAPSSVVMALVPIMAVVLIGFLIIGLAMPVLPLHVNRGLGLGTVMVGLVAGSQFAASLVSRVWSGHFSDSRGAKHAVIGGLLAASAAGLLYFLSLRFIDTPILSVTILLLGRAMLGGAESFIITGATIWGLARVGQQSAGKVIAWMGTAMFAAFAGGAPLGAALYEKSGFVAIAAATTLAPLAILVLVAPLQPVPPEQKGRPNFLSVARQIWMPGLGSALSSIGFGTVTTFSSLLFVQRNWSPVWLAFTAYAAALIVARLSLGHLPDRIGGAKVALYSVLVEAGGLALMGLAPSSALAGLGAALTGLGYALVFPGFGVVAVRRALPEVRGLAMGAYTACLDLALGVVSPLLGLIANGAGLTAVFFTSTVMVLGAAPVAMRLLSAPRPVS